MRARRELIPFVTSSALLAAALAALLSCTNPVAPEGAVPIPRPALYAELWDRAQQCTGRSGSLERIRWYVVEPDLPNAHFSCRELAGGCTGLWVEPHAIYLSAALTTSEALIVHEMIHDLLQDGTHRHPAFETCQ